MKERLYLALGIAVCAFVLTLGVRTANAQSEATLRGYVAAADESGVAGARVSLTWPDGRDVSQTATDSSGQFTLSGVAPGEYMLSVGADGFAPRRLRLVLQPREVSTVELTLDVARVAVTVEVTGDIRPSTHSPSSTLLTQAALDEMPLARRTNLPDAIVTAAPGMIRGHDDFVHIRGHEVALNPAINGVQFWENAHAVFSPGLGVDYIESINVMTGGFSAEYGNRFGGVLDVVTKSGRTMSHRGSFTLGTGTAQRHDGGVEVGGSGGRAAYYVNLSGFTSDRFLSPPAPRSIHNSGQAIRSFGRLDVRPANGDQITAVLTGDGVNFELPMEERDERLRPNFRNAQRARSQSAIVSWNRAQGVNTALQTALYQRWSSVRQFPEAIDPYGAQTRAERTLRTVGLKGDVARFVGRHAVKAGIDAVLLNPREDLSYLSQPWIDFTHLANVNENHVHFRGPNLGAGIPRPVIFNERETGGQASLFVQDKMQLTSSLTVDAGVRFDRYSLAMTDSHVSPRLNVAFRLPAGTVLFASYNHFFVPPPIENLLAGSAGLTTLVSEIGQSLPPVRALTEDQFEAGLTHAIAGVGSVGVTSYYRVSDDPPHTSIFPDSRFYTYATFDKGKAYGMEVRADLRRLVIPALSGYVNYALGRVWFYNPIVAGFTTEAGHLTEAGRFLAPMDQTHTVTSGITYNHARTRLWTTVSAEYGSGTPGGHGGGDHEHESGETHEHASGPGTCAARCPSRVTPNLSIGWNALARGGQSRVSVQFNIENLTNKVYLLSKESSMVQGQYSIPRLISASVRMRF